MHVHVVIIKYTEYCIVLCLKTKDRKLRRIEKTFK